MSEIGDTSEIKQQLNSLHSDWCLSADEQAIKRRFSYTGFNKGIALVQLCASLADRQNHHPDIALGWGYCEIKYTTHSLGRLTNKDIDSARALDNLLNRAEL